MSTKKPALGRGLGALLNTPDASAVQIKTRDENEIPVGQIAELPLEQISTNPYQPRTKFEEDALNELSDSIKQMGLIQPITVRKSGKNKYELISGERRFRASKLAGLTTIPAYIRLADDQAMLEMALVENIQREQLDPIEVALSYQRLMDECNLTQEEVSKKVSKSRSAVANFLRLLKLPPAIQAALRDQKISMGHARALISIESEKEQLDLFNRMLNESWTVRQAEEESKKSKKTPETPAKIEAFDNPYDVVGQQLQQHLKLGVIIKTGKTGKGSITIQFANEKELKKVIEKLSHS
jgi:ParB family chromosome partitioning protein